MLENVMPRLLLCAILLPVVSCDQAENVPLGKVTVVDGGSFRTSDTTFYTLDGITAPSLPAFAVRVAPEAGDIIGDIMGDIILPIAIGDVAHDMLTEKLKDANIECAKDGIKTRQVVCWAGADPEISINEWMVEQGWVLTDDKRFKDASEMARVHGRGLHDPHLYFFKTKAGKFATPDYLLHLNDDDKKRMAIDYCNFLGKFFKSIPLDKCVLNAMEAWQ